MMKIIPIILTGVFECGHCSALIVPHAYSNNREMVGASRLEVLQHIPVFTDHKGTVMAGHTEVVLVMVHALWKGPGEVDGVHGLRVHHDGARRVGN